MEILDTVLSFLNTVIWEYLLIYVLIGTGIYFTVRTNSYGSGGFLTCSG